MNENRQVYQLASVLVVFGIALFLYKVMALNYPLSGEQRTELWDIEAHIVFQGTGGSARLDLLAPKNTRRYVIVDEVFASRGYGMNIVEQKGNRHVIWTIREATGRQDIYYRATVKSQGGSDESESFRERKVNSKPHVNEEQDKAAKAIIEGIRKRYSDTPSFVSDLFGLLQASQDRNVSLLLGRQPSKVKLIKVAVDLLQTAGIPARPVYGIVLDENRKDVPISPWLQVFDRGVWRSIDPSTGRIGIPDNYFTWWRGSTRLLSIKGAGERNLTISISRSNVPAISTFANTGLPKDLNLSRLSLFSLPIETQVVYRILLTIPVGALILVLLRNVVGIRTFGTFMPVLIALAFRETQLAWGLVLFSLVVALGLAARFYLDHLKLLLVPRLASVLIIVVLLMAALSVLSHFFGVERGLSVALFPMVIMTMTIERMSIVWEERGRNEALRQGLGSLFVAAVAYLFMTIRLVEHLVFVFPELLLVILAITLMLGRYTGYRLTELWRFRALAGK